MSCLGRSTLEAEFGFGNDKKQICPNATAKFAGDKQLCADSDGIHNNTFQLHLFSWFMFPCF